MAVVAGLLRGIRNAAERTYLEPAKRIEADRTARENPKTRGATWNSQTLTVISNRAERIKDHLACPGPVTPGPQLSRSYRVETMGLRTK